MTLRLEKDNRYLTDEGDAVQSMARTHVKQTRYDRRRGEVIAAGAAVFAEHGYHGASTKMIAERVGIRQGSLYYYFSSKEAALEEVCRIDVESMLKGLSEIVGGSGSASKKVRRAVLNHLAPLLARPDFMRTFLNERQHLPAESRKRIGRLARRYERLMENLIREGVRRREFSGDLDPGLAALALIGQCNAVLTWYGRRHKSLSVEQIAEANVRMFLDGVVARHKIN